MYIYIYELIHIYLYIRIHIYLYIHIQRDYNSESYDAQLFKSGLLGLFFKQLGVSPNSGMIWLRFGIRKLNFHDVLRKLKKTIFDPFLKKFGGKTFSLQNNRNSDLRPSIFWKLLLTMSKNIKSQNDCQDSEL